MVKLAVRFLGQKPVTCNARPLLSRAYAAVERGSWIEAGCQLREACRLFLEADCEFNGVELSKRKIRRTPRALLAALSAAGFCDEFCFEWIDRAIEVGNRAAHCQFVRPVELCNAIENMHFVLDSCKYLVQPVAAGRLS